MLLTIRSYKNTLHFYILATNNYENRLILNIYNSSINNNDKD